MAEDIHIAVRGPSGVRDVVLTVPSAETTIAQVADQLGFRPGPLLIDGRRVPGSATVDEARLWDGAMLAAPHDFDPAAPVVGPGPAVVALDQVAGLSGGDSIRLAPGRFVFGPTGLGRTVGADAESTVEEPSLHSGDPEEVAFALEVADDGTITVYPGRLPASIDGREVIGPTTLGSRVIDTGSARFRARPIADDERRIPKSRAFHRSPRTAIAAADARIAALDLPTPVADVARLSWITMLAPLPVAALMVVVMGSPRFALFALMSPLMILGRWVEGKRIHRKETKRWRAEVDDQVDHLDAEIEALRSDLSARCRDAHPGVGDLIERAIHGAPSLWERRPGHSDFGTVRVGMGDVGWDPPIDLDNRAPNELLEVVDRHRGLSSVPLVADLRDGPLGISGPRRHRLAAARAIVTSLAVQSSPSDLPICLVTDRTRLDEWDWLKWLPHLGTPRRVAIDGDEIDALVDQLRREPLPRHRKTDASPEPLPIFVIDDVAALRAPGSPLRRALFEDCGISAVVLADSDDDLPASCSWVLHLHSDGTARFTEVDTGRALDPVTPGGCSAVAATRAARSVSWMEDPDGLTASGDLPVAVTLPEVAGSTDAEAVFRRWEDAGPNPNPVAVIGRGPSGALELDLVGDGPHGLLAGTTGAGKSELLRTFVASLALAYSPDLVNFVLIDYKGGGAFDVCAELPHTVAMVTDLDGHLGARALRSLQAELKHREVLFRAVDAHDLSAYRATGAVLPRLVVVVDEFATLAAELPDFLDALVDIAQRGRSLGIHMILATQRPAGVVDNKIKANTNMRIALRVQDEADSTDVIGNELAARLRREDLGRGYVRLGAGDVVPFQAAYVGGPRSAAAGDRDLSARPFSLASAVGGTSHSSDHVSDGPTELEHLAQQVSLAFAKSELEPPRRPWLPELAERIDADELLSRTEHRTLAAPIGQIDEPAAQRQEPFWFHASDGNALVYGADEAATSQTLTTIAVAMAKRHQADDLHLYVVDTGSALLRPLADLPHCGAYVPMDDLDLVSRLFDVLDRAVSERRALRRTGSTDDGAAILVVIEGLGSMFEILADAGNSDLSSRLLRLLRDGPSLGLTVVGSSAHDRGIPSRIAAQVSVKLVHRLADPASYMSFGLRPRDVPVLTGSRFVDVRTGLDGVIASIGECDLDPARAAVPSPDVRRPPVPIRVVPDRVTRDDLTIDSRVEGTRLVLPVGLDVQSVEPCCLVIEDKAAVFGPASSGRTTALTQLTAQAIAAGVEGDIVVVAESSSPLATLPGVTRILAPSLGVEEVGTLDISSISLLVVDDADRVSDELGERLSTFATQTGRGTWMLVATRPDAVKAFGSWLACVRGASGGLLLQPQPGDGDVLRTVLTLRAPQQLPLGRGFLVANGSARLVQAAEQ